MENIGATKIYILERPKTSLHHPFTPQLITHRMRRGGGKGREWTNGGIIWFSGGMERGSVVTNRVYMGDYRKLNANLLQERGVWVLKMLNRLGGWVTSEFFCDTTLQRIMISA